SPADFLPRQTLLFKLSRPIADLQGQLLDTFSGQTLTMREIYEKHNVDTPYIKKNYKHALLELEASKLIVTGAHRKNTFADSVRVTFGRKKPN
ncbi:MAG TPA: hypothetical protein VMW69_05560, partial [Spirochaetia bacterium]|nr:hypothetical protein [Spirochaetia bacterium]